MWNLPNIITIIRIAMTPVIALLPFIEGYWPKFLAFIIFVITALTDLVDGYLARSRGEVTDLGKLLDPLADKLLLIAALVPIYWIARERQDLYGIPFWGSIPLWVCLLLLGRELAMTVFRRFAQKRGVVIAAGNAGKLNGLPSATPPVPSGGKRNRSAGCGPSFTVGSWRSPWGWPRC